MAGLIFGALPLLNVTRVQRGGASTQFWLDVSMDGTDWGEPEATVAQITSQLLDGDRADITRFGNRRVTLMVRINGSSHDALAEGERALMNEINRGQNTLAWNPGSDAAVGVFDVVYSTMRHVFNSNEFAQFQRIMAITFVCLPGVRRQLATVTVATPVPAGAPVVTVINDCTSSLGWSAAPNTNGSSGGGIHTLNVSNGNILQFTRTTPFATALLTTDFLLVEWSTNTGVWSPVLNVTIGGNPYILSVAATELVSATRVKWYYSIPQAGTLTGFSFQINIPPPPPYATSLALDLWEVSKVNQLPSAGSGRQRSFSVSVGGTMRTAADLLVEGVGSNLGDEVIVYSAPQVTLQPNLRPLLFSSAASSTVSPGTGPLLSGRWQELNTTPSEYRIPLSAITSGSYLLAARLISDGSKTRTISWSALSSSSFANGSTNQVSGSVSVALTAAGGFYQLGVLTLPTLMAGKDNTTSVRIVIQGSGGTVIGLDELYLFNLDDGELTWLGLTGGIALPNRVLLQNATLDSNGQSSWMAGANGSGAEDISVAERAVSLGTHQFRPGQVSNIFVATPNEPSQTVTVTAFDRFHTGVPKAA